MKHYLLQIQGGGIHGTMQVPPVAVASVSTMLVELVDACRKELIRLHAKFPMLDYLVLRDYTPDFPERVALDIQEKLGKRYNSVVDGDSDVEELTLKEREEVCSGTPWRVGYCLLHISDSGIWWEAVDKYSDIRFSTAELCWKELGIDA
jgi:hypothetical protein